MAVHDCIWLYMAVKSCWPKVVTSVCNSGVQHLRVRGETVQRGVRTSRRAYVCTSALFCFDDIVHPVLCPLLLVQISIPSDVVFKNDVQNSQTYT